jgi:hypothetical protein
MQSNAPIHPAPIREVKLQPNLYGRHAAFSTNLTAAIRCFEPHFMTLTIMDYDYEVLVRRRVKAPATAVEH